MNFHFRDNQVEPGHLGRRALRSGAASLAARCINASIQIGIVLVLARLLTPEDYGLVSMVTAITGFAPLLVDLGTHDAVIQRHQITESEISALFWINMGMGFVGACLVAACGPLIARFYGEPRLTMITIVSGLTFITTALTCQHSALLRRSMKFQEIGIIEVCANLISAGGAIAMAVYGFHYWALVVRPLTMTLLLSAGVWWESGWLPSRPKLTAGVKQMMGFGIHSTGSTMTGFASNSSAKVAIGYRGGATSLGYYQNAMLVYNNLLDLMIFPLLGVAVSSLSKVKENSAEVRRLWGKALSTLVFYTMPVFGMLAVTSQDLIVPILGKKWSSAGVLLSILALRGIPHSVEKTLAWLHMTAGRPDRWLRWMVFGTGVQAVALLLGLPFGPRGVVISYVVLMFLIFIPSIAYAGKPFDIGAAQVTKVVWRPFVGSLAAAGIGFILRHTILTNVPGIPRTAILIFAYVFAYLGMVVYLFRVRAPLGVVLSLLREVLPARFASLVKTPSFIERHAEELL